MNRLVTTFMNPICMPGPGGRNDNLVSESFFSLIIDEATCNRMTSLKTLSPTSLTQCGPDLTKECAWAFQKIML